MGQNFFFKVATYRESMPTSDDQIAIPYSEYIIKFNAALYFKPRLKAPNLDAKLDASFVKILDLAYMVP